MEQRELFNFQEAEKPKPLSKKEKQAIKKKWPELTRPIWEGEVSGELWGEIKEILTTKKGKEAQEAIEKILKSRGEPDEN